MILDSVKIKSEVVVLIMFKILNLLYDWLMKGLFDVIFCCNVLIYFDWVIQVELIVWYYVLFSQGGYLMLGYSESLLVDYIGFEVVGRMVFCRL